MRMNAIRLFGALAVMLFAAAPQLFAQKIGVVDFQQALLNTADMQKQAAELEAKYQPRQQQLEALSRELQQLQTQLQSAQGEQAATLQQQGAMKQREAQRLSEDLQSEIDFDREGILQSGAEKMRTVVNQLREQRKLDLIVDVSSALSYNPSLDLTQAATEAYNKAHPAK